MRSQTDPTTAASADERFRRCSVSRGASTISIVTPDGRRVYWLNPVFYGIPVRESQIVQEVVEQLRVLVVPAPGFDTDASERIVERLRARVGDVDIRVETVESIPRTAGGKFRAVISHLSHDIAAEPVNAS